MAINYFGLSAEQINKIRVQSGAKALDFGKTTTSTTNPLTNPRQSAASVTQGVISVFAPNTSGITLNQPTSTASSANTINGKPIPTSGTNDPSMFAIPQGDV